MTTNDKSTSPLGVLIIIILTALLSMFATMHFTESKIQTKYKTEVKTDIKRVHHTDTVYIVKNGHISHTVRPITEADTNNITQVFDVSDSTITASVKTVAKDSVLSIDIDYKYDQAEITNTDTLFITNTITNTVERTIMEQPKTRILIGAEMMASKNTWQASPSISIDFKRKCLISVRMAYQQNIGLIYGGGISIPLGKR